MNANLIQYNLQIKKTSFVFVKSTTMENFGHLIKLWFVLWNLLCVQFVEFDSWFQNMVWTLGFIIYFARKHTFQKRWDMWWLSFPQKNFGCLLLVVNLKRCVSHKLSHWWMTWKTSCIYIIIPSMLQGV